MHIVKPGETLWRISRQYDTTIAAITQANNLANPNLIRVGQQLMIPGHPIVPLAPVQPQTTSGSPFTHRTYTNLYNGRPARVFITKVRLAAVQSAILYPGAGPPFKNRTVSSMAREWGADLAVNASFFYGGYPLGRHIKNGCKLYDYPSGRPTVILDKWRLDTWYNGVQRLIDSGAQEAFSSYPYLLWQGNRWISKYPSSLGGLHPRTAIGLSKNEKALIVVVVDGRRVGYRLGVTLSELQAILTAEGAWQWALNLDGGGSSTMYYNGKIVNRPSDGRERAVVNALAFKVKQ